MLTEDTAHTCEQYLTTNKREDSAEHQAKIFNSLVFRGKLLSAVRWIADIEKGGVLQTGESDPNQASL